MNKVDVNKLGNTSMIRLKNIEKKYNLNVSLYAKNESENPTGSVKDRAVYQMLLDGVNAGTLKEGSTVIEATSGNTGISLAAFGPLFGLKVIIVMPDNMSLKRRELIKGYGAELCLIKGGMKECNEQAQKLVKELSNSVILGQFDNLSNMKAHYLTTGKEIVEQVENVDYIFAGIGSGGTISGIGKYMKENKPNVKCIGIEPKQSPLITEGVAHSHLIQGIGANFIPNNFVREYVNEVITVDDSSSIEMSKKILELENVDVGYSSGANLLGAINYVKENNIESGNIVVIFPDSGSRYR